MRYRELDSLRGLAALFVVLSHCMLLLPIYGGYNGEILEQTRLSTLLNDSPLHLFWSGHQSVMLFFILSGFVLSLPFYSDKKLPYPKYLVRRIFRIYFPYSVSLIVTVILFVIFRSTTQVSNYSDWFNTLWAGPLNINIILDHIFFIGEYNADVYNPVYWSLVQEMRISLIFPFIMLFVMKFDWKINISGGAILSFISLFIVSKTGVGTESIIFTPHYISMFVVGAVLAKKRQFFIDNFKSFSTTMKFGVGVFGLLCYTYSFIFPSLPFVHKYIINEWVTVLGAATVIVITLGSDKFKNFLVKKPFNFLGKISYSLYLYHLPILISLMFLLHDILPFTVIVFLAIVVSIFVAHQSYQYVEKPFIKLGRKFTAGDTKKVSVKEAI